MKIVLTTILLTTGNVVSAVAHYQDHTERVVTNLEFAHAEKERVYFTGSFHGFSYHRNYFALEAKIHVIYMINDINVVYFSQGRNLHSVASSVPNFNA